MPTPFRHRSMKRQFDARIPAGTYNLSEEVLSLEMRDLLTSVSDFFTRCKGLASRDSHLLGIGPIETFMER